MSHRILNVNVSLQSINQPQLCEQMLEAMTRDDRDSILIVTSTQRISVSSKMLQIFSPLYRDILRDIPCRDSDPVTLIIPDTEANHIQHLLELLMRGTIKEGSSRDIVTLAECFKIRLKEKVLSDIVQKLPPKIKVKNLEVEGMLNIRSLDKEKFQKESKKPKEVIAKKVSGTVKWFNVKGGYGFTRKDTEEDVFVHQSAILQKVNKSVGDGEDVEFDVVFGENGNTEASNVTGPNGSTVKSSPHEKKINRRTDRCSFCYKKFKGGIRNHEQRECKNRPDAPVCSICSKKIAGGRKSLKKHEDICRLW